MPAWYDVCLYVARNAVKHSKTGLSRTALVSAATGKEGSAADMDAKRKGAAGDVLVKLADETNHVVSLLSDDTNLTRHLSEIYRLPHSTRQLHRQYNACTIVYVFTCETNKHR